MSTVPLFLADVETEEVLASLRITDPADSNASSFSAR